MTTADFERWVKRTKASGTALNKAGYVQLERPTEREPVRLFGSVDDDLFHAIVNRCIAPGSVCMDATMKGAAHAGMEMPMSMPMPHETP